MTVKDAKRKAVSARLKAAKRLARRRYSFDDDTVTIYLVKGRSKSRPRSEKPIVLVQVSRDTIPTGVVPLAFPARPESGVPAPYVLIDLTEREFADLKKKLGEGKPVKGWHDGWKLGAEITREKAGATSRG